MRCREHPEAEAVAVCQKFEVGFCQACCDAEGGAPACACPSPDVHCRYRQSCVVHYRSRRHRKGRESR